MSRGIAALAQAVRFRVLARHSGELALSLSGLALVPAGVALATGRLGVAGVHGVSVVVLIGLGLGLSRVDAPRRIQRNEALVVTVGVFVIGAVVLAAGFVAEGVPVVDAVFEAVSSITTTGLTTLESVESRSASFLTARAWGQWYGGLAILVLAAALIMEPGTAARRLTKFDASRQDLSGSTRAWGRRVLVIYAVLTVVAFSVLWLTLGDPFRALLHALTSVSTGGFSPFDDSLAATPALHRWPVIIIALLGAASYSAHSRAWSGDWRSLRDDRSLKALLAMAAAVTLAVAVTLWGSGTRTLAGALGDAPLLALSAQATSGFSTTDVGSLDAASKAVLIVSMVTGGDVGSTAGGIKIVRLFVILSLMRIVVVRTALPDHAAVGATTGTARPEPAEVRTAIGLVLLYGAGIGISWVAFLLAGAPPLDSLFDVASAFGTVGLSTGVVGPELAVPLKLLLCVDMLMGRTEMIAVLVLLYPRTWIGRRPSSS